MERRAGRSTLEGVTKASDTGVIPKTKSQRHKSFFICSVLALHTQPPIVDLVCLSFLHLIAEFPFSHDTMEPRIRLTAANAVWLAAVPLAIWLSSILYRGFCIRMMFRRLKAEGKVGFGNSYISDRYC